MYFFFMYFPRRLRYKGYFGGVTAMTKDQFHQVNGFSNTYWGWGGEDDDLRIRWDPNQWRRYLRLVGFLFITSGVAGVYIPSFIYSYMCVSCLVQSWAAENEDYATARWCSSLHHGVSQTGQWQWNKQRQVSKCRIHINVLCLFQVN